MVWCHTCYISVQSRFDLVIFFFLSWSWSAKIKWKLPEISSEVEHIPSYTETSSERSLQYTHLKIGRDTFQTASISVIRATPQTVKSFSFFYLCFLAVHTLGKVVVNSQVVSGEVIFFFQIKSPFVTFAFVRFLTSYMFADPLSILWRTLMQICALAVTKHDNLWKKMNCQVI